MVLEGRYEGRNGKGLKVQGDSFDRAHLIFAETLRLFP
jgi:hypothetical protein